MLLKRLYRAGKCVGVEVKHTGLHAAQNFSARFVDDGLVQGWISIDGDKLTIASEPEALHYTCRRSPGYYCRSNGERIPISAAAWASSRRGELASREARAWLKAKGRPEHDYEVTDAYECVLDDAEHAKYRGVRAKSGALVACCELEG